jgi:autophagy-related protein 5
MALNSILPTLFPSRRDAIVAEPVLHGACVPFRAPLEELMREAAYADGWVHLSVSMVDA